MSTGRARVAILLSGRGSNFLALHAATRSGALDADIVQVISNVPEAAGLAKARSLGLSAEAIPHRGLSREAHDQQVVDALRRANAEWVCLAGYMRLLSPVLVDAFPQRVLNIHPSLLPAFPGLEAQRQAWDYGVKVSGCTVHLVDHGMDSGPIVMQDAVDIADAVSPSEVSARILEREHRLYPQALQSLIANRWRLEGRRIAFFGKAESCLGRDFREKS